MFKPRPQLLQHTTAPVALTAQPWQQNQTNPDGGGAGSGGSGGDQGAGKPGEGAGSGNGTDGTKQGDPADADKLGDAGKRALDKERDRADAAEKRARELEQSLADSKLSEEQRAQKAAEKAIEDARAETAAKSGELTTAQQTIARYEAAEKAGLPLSMAKRLVGTTVEELAKDAAELAQTIPGNRRPRPDHTQGLGSGGSKPGGSVAAAKQEHLANRTRK